METFRGAVGAILVTAGFAAVAVFGAFGSVVPAVDAEFGATVGDFPADGDCAGDIPGPNVVAITFGVAVNIYMKKICTYANSYKRFFKIKPELNFVSSKIKTVAIKVSKKSGLYKKKERC